MSELRLYLDGLRSEALPELPDARLEEDFAELHRLGELLEAERLRRFAEIDQRGLYERDGHLSAASWLASRFRLAWGLARDHVRVARALERIRATREAVEAGAVSMSAVRVLASACEAEPDAYRRAETELLDAARIHSVADLQRVVAFWRQTVDQERSLGGHDALRERRRLHASVTLLGSVRVDGDLDPETGETLLTALRAVLDAEARSGTEDTRTPAQRRADGLGEICRQWLDRGDRPTVAGERPHLTVTVAAEALQANRGVPGLDRVGPSGLDRVGPAGFDHPGRVELDHTGPVDASTARQVACDASVMRVVMTGRSEPLDVGRRTPVVPAALRRAVIVRDRHCRFPGCGRPQAWCDAHHIVHWADGGATALANLLLLCGRHHGMVHRAGGFGLDLQDGRPIFRRPDGSILEDRAPP
jgi:hypothetical protein